jgi:hypothetical protein
MELYFNCKTLTTFNKKEKLCCELLGIPNEGATHYAKPLIDINGKYWLLINSDVQFILTEAELATCKEFNEIELQTETI